MNNLTVYRASAGSGKTFTLAVQYIKLLVENPHAYRHTLAVTFTNKATEEMKMRILSQLYGISRGLKESKPYLESVKQQTSLDETTIINNASYALSELIHNYSYFRVETIDAFFQTVLRNLARELELTANLRIELNDQQVEQQAVDQLIEDLNDSSLLLSWILDYIHENMDDDKSWNVIAQIKHFGMNIFKDYYKKNRQKIKEIFEEKDFFKHYTGQLRAIRKHADEQIKKCGDDFFELLDSVTIARSRKHIEKYYDTAEVGKFPERNKPISLRPQLTDISTAINYNQIYEHLMMLSLCIYTPSNYIFPSRVQKYIDLTHNKGDELTQVGREQGIRKLMSINLLKRLESSVNSFRLTLQRMKSYIDTTINAIEMFEANGTTDIDVWETSDYEFDVDDSNTELFMVGKKVKISLADMDYKTWKSELTKDAEILGLLDDMISDITPEHDSKLQELFKLISAKIENPINHNNKKVLIFSAFSDTAEYLYDNIGSFIKEKYGLDTAVITGSIDGKTTIKGFKATLNNVLTCFSPLSKGKDLLMPDNKTQIDILIATDCISEGQNLQDCDYLVNYDIHWNPVRIIQRFGRIDRIGSKNKVIQLVNFWPDMDLDEYINLKARVETRMKISIMTSTGDDDLINPEENGDLEYRKQQLKKLQEEVVDIEDMATGISIMDLGLNEFRLDLLEYVKNNGDIDNKPKGLHAVVPATNELPGGVIFILKNVNNSVNIDNRNRIHPFYMVYIGTSGNVICDYLEPKSILDNLRLLCRGKKEPISPLCQKFNHETNDGKDMSKMSKLLSEAISSIINKKEESDIDSLFSAGGTSALMSAISGLDDFELICFLVIK